MVTAVKVPFVGMAAEEVTLVRWLKKEGEIVSEGEALAEVEMDKATVELTAAAKGNLLRILAAEGQLVRPGDVVAEISENG